MKKLILSLAIFSTLFIACEDKKGQILDPNAMISIRPASGVKAQTANPEHLTDRQIVEQATDIWFWNLDIVTENSLGRAFGEHQRDLDNLRLLMFGTDIIDQDGNFEPSFIEGFDIILTKQTGPNAMDTIGYIKNETLRTAESQIKEAYAREDYATCYAIFDEAFTFLPITAKEWETLKAQGIN